MYSLLINWSGSRATKLFSKSEIFIPVISSKYKKGNVNPTSAAKIWLFFSAFLLIKSGFLPGSLSTKKLSEIPTL